jgi:hypothetical protein
MRLIDNLYGTFKYGAKKYGVVEVEPIPSKIFRDFLDRFWILTNRPNMIEANELPSEGHGGSMRYDLQYNDYIIIRLSPRGIEEQLIHNWNDRLYTAYLDIEVMTINGRTRLWDFEKEIRRIVQQYHHSLAPFQLSRFLEFRELTMSQKNVFMAIATIQLESAWQSNT